MTPAREHLLAYTAAKGPLTFGEWSQEALFGHPHGYYRQKRTRVGHGREADFATNLQHAPALAPLLLSAWERLCGKAFIRSAALFLVGEEPESSLGQFFPENTFASIHSLPLGAPWPPEERRIIFANEVLDAQPFERFHWDGQSWTLLAVEARAGDFHACPYPSRPGPALQAILESLPPLPFRGYVYDFSPAASDLLSTWLDGKWAGLFFTLDYGHFKEILLSEFPSGTARGYVNHRQIPDVLQAGGEGDLTFHLCWDGLIEILQAKGFEAEEPLRQDRFFFRFAQEALRRMIEHQSASGLDPLLGHARALALPGALGSRLHALWGIRGGIPTPDRIPGDFPDSRMA